MSNSVTIKCSNYGSILTFSEKTDDYWFVGIKGKDLSGKIRIHDHIDNPERLFKDISKDWKGFEGTKSYKSLEGELVITARHDRKSHIELQIALTPNDSPDDWVLKFKIFIQINQLEHLSQKVEEFFEK